MSEQPLPLINTAIEKRLEPLRRVCRQYLAQAFWAAPSTWPRGNSDYIFVGDALAEAGRALYPSEWTGNETAAFAAMPVYTDPIPIRVPTTKSIRTLATVMREKELSSSSGEPAPTEHVSDYIRHLAMEIWARERAENDSRATRLLGAVDWLVSRARDGELVTALRFVNTSLLEAHFMPVGGGVWHTEPIIPNRFAAGFFDHIFPGQARAFPVYAFFTRESLARALGAVRVASLAPVEADGVWLSPYIKLMLAAVRQLQITENHAPKKQVIVDTLNALAPSFGLELTGNEVGMLATFTRHPRMKEGRAARLEG